MTSLLRPFLAALAIAGSVCAQAPRDAVRTAGAPAGQVMAPIIPSITLNGIIGQGSGGACESSGTQNDRIYRDAIPSSCASPKAWPGTLGWGTYTYDTYQLVNNTGMTQCVTMTVWVPGSDMVHLSVYNGAYDPANQGANYLADTGSSAYGGSASLSVSVAAGQSVVAVALNPSGTSGNSYTFTFDYLTVGCGPAYDLYFEDDQLRSRLWLNSTTGAWSMDMLTGPLTGNYTGTTTPILKGGLIALPLPTTPGKALWGFYDPMSRRATFTLRSGSSAYYGFLLDTNTTGSLPPLK